MSTDGGGVRREPLAVSLPANDSCDDCGIRTVVCAGDERHGREGEALVARFLLICLGGAIGTGARYMVAIWAARTAGAGFPLGTLLVNVTGSFLLGVLMQLSLSTQMISADARLIVGTGILGGFTTYSTFNYETLALIREEAWGIALLNLAATLIGCLLAGALGVLAVRSAGH